MKKNSLTSLIYSMALLALLGISQFTYAGSACSYGGKLVNVIHTGSAGLDFRLSPLNKDNKSAFQWIHNQWVIRKATVPNGGQVCITCQYLNGDPYMGTKIWDRAYTSLNKVLTVGFLPDYFLGTGYKGRDPSIPVCSSPYVFN